MLDFKGGETGRKYGDPLVFAIVALAYLVFWAPLGLDTGDGGFILGLSWRVFSGAVPYKDFFYIRTPVPVYLHAVPLLFGNYAIYADRALFLFQFVGIALCGARMLVAISPNAEDRQGFWATAAVTFVFSVHHWSLFGWHTSDGVFFSVLGLFALSREKYLAAGAFTSAAMLSKQNFALVMALFGAAAFTAGVQPGLRYLVGAAAV